VAVERRAFPLAAVPRASSRGGPSTPAPRAGGAANDAGQSGSAGSAGSAGGGGVRGPGQGGDGGPVRGHELPRGRVKGRSAGAHGRIHVGLASATSAGSEGGPAASSIDARSRHTPAYVAGGLGLLAMALVGGFFLYRRRLP